MVAAAVAVGATAAAAAAAQAAQAANAPGAPDIAVPTFTREERGLIRQNRQLLDEQRTSTEQGANILSRLAPDQLRALGYDVTTSTVDPAELAAAQQRVADLQTAIGEAETRRIAARGGKKRGGDKKARREARLDRNKLQLELDQAQAELGRLQANPTSITGISRTPSEADVQAGDIETGLQARILAALESGGAVDPSLEREAAEQERILRAKLQRDFGPDYEATTVGAAAIRDFEARRDEAFTNDRRNTLAQLVGTTSGFSTDLLNRIIARQDASSAVGGNQLKAGEALRGSAQAFTDAARPFQSLRGDKLARDTSQAQLDQQAEAEKQALISGAIQSGTSAAGAAAGGAGAYYSAGKSTGSVLKPSGTF